MDRVRQLLAAGDDAVYEFPGGKPHAWVDATLKALRYRHLGRADKGLARRLIKRVTGLSRSQVTRLIGCHLRGREVKDRRGAPPANGFKRKYGPADVALLAEMDRRHGTPSGPAMRKLCERAFRVFGDQRFERLAGVSNGQVYNMRASAGYRRHRCQVDKTRPAKSAIGERRKPAPDGRPGWLRVDTVHQGDLDRIKGLYHINAVDEVTQMQAVVSVEKISERCLMPALAAILAAFPFAVRGFHTDNGSEYVNTPVAELLDKLRIEFTKSRARRSNDNALVEGKNAATVRKHLGHAHIPQRCAERVNAFAAGALTPHLNYHRPCYFPREEADAKGKIKKRYRYGDMMTPYEKLRSLPDAASYLKPGVSFEELDAIAMQMSDNESADRLNKAAAKLFQSINQPSKSAA